MGNNPVVGVDPEGLRETGSFWANVFSEESLDQLGMSAEATVTGIASGLTGGASEALGFDLSDPCDPYRSFSKGAGKVAGAALGLAVGAKLGGFNPRLRLGRHVLGKGVLRRAGVPGKVAGRLKQAGEKILHLNIDNLHVIINRYNWYRPRKWFVK